MSSLKRTRIKKRRKVRKESWRWELIQDGAVVRYADREVCQDNAAGKREYKRRTLEMAARQKNRCSLCGDPFTDEDPPTFEHSRARGLGGAFRDDSVSKNTAAHLRCNSDKGSQSLEYYKARNPKQ